MSRRAILIGNTARSKLYEFNVNLKQLKRKIGDIRRILESLGEYRFQITEILNEKRDAAEVSIKNEIRRYSQKLAKEDTGDSVSCLLVYYFGHGVQRKNDLCFVFKDSRTSEYPSLLPFNRISELVADYSIPCVIFILDCCYAGAAAQQVHSSITSGTDYSILASTIPTQKSALLGGVSPFGVFSLVLFEGLLDEYAVDPGIHKITPHSLFEYILKKFEELQINQAPYKYDGGLDAFPITEIERVIIVDPRFNVSAPKRCFYKKLGWIINKIKEEGGNITSEYLYKVVLSSKPEELLTPIRKNGRYENAPVSETTFRVYLERLHNLKIIHEGEPLRLTRSGLSLLSKAESEFNPRLFELIEEEFRRHNYSFEKLDKLVRFKTHIRRVPSSSNLYSDAKSKDNLSMDPIWFYVLLDLLAQAGYLKYSSQRTYFPY